jgi:leader peptidase (prepilin peptidase)/N-methyltransferase
VPLEDLVAGPGALVVAFVLGALLGSFANVCILRIPRGESIVRPPSHCGSCGAPVRWFDNLPIVSFLVLRGRCRACGASFSARYLLVEIACGLLVAAVWHLALHTAGAADELPLRLARFGVYTFIDLDHMQIPDRITYPGIPIFFAFGVLLGDVALLDQVIGVAVGYGLVRLISDVYFWITKREGMGYGDGKLLALIGGLFGWQGVAFSLFGGSLLGTLLVVPVLAVVRRGTSLRKTELPFGPLLAAAAVVYLFVRELVRVELSLWW